MEITSQTLGNGLTSVIVPMKDRPTATVLVMVGTGTRHENKGNNGISHFLEHMCFKGTESRPGPADVSIELDGLGAESNAFTWYEYTGYYGKSAAKNTGGVLDVVADIYKNSTLPASEIEKEAGVITEEIRMYEDMPMRTVHDVFRELIYNDQSLGHRILGPAENVQSFVRDDFVQYRERHYVPENTTIVVAGGIDPGSIASSIADRFAEMPAKQAPEHPEVGITDNDDVLQYEHKDSDQSHLVMGAPTVPATSDDLPAVEVLSTILGRGMSSRLFRRLRNDMGVCYYVRSACEYFHENGLFKVATGVDTSRVAEVVDVIEGEIGKLLTEDITAKELEKSKEFLIGNFLMGHESTNEIAYDLAEKSVFGKPLTAPQERAEKIRKVDEQDVKRVAKETFADGLRAAVVGPEFDQSAVRKTLQTD